MRFYQVRVLISYILFAITIGNLFLVAALPSYYYATLPRAADKTSGREHVLNNHGTYVYLNDAETTGLSLIFIAAVASISLFAIIVPKHVGATGLTALNYTRGRFTVVLLTLMGYVLFVLLAGPYIVSIAVSHGLILSVMTT